MAKIKPGSMLDKQMEKKMGIKPGSKADKMMEAGKAMPHNKMLVDQTMPMGKMPSHK